ncbi:endonuclease/exonuclease/phosphatase family protein [Mycobacterium sp. smrl_JER01]|uniref:endonuclease/exonuclease/phosphatase family protein n=1 Tax=Mycobacterium sp. smrl_JER01 TaxID=3402633 RepID=UPI003AD104B5
MRTFFSEQTRRLKWALRPRRTVTVARFDAETDRWVDVEAAVAVERDALTVVTFNIWFGDHHALERYRAIANVLEPHAPDVIAFQEVTSEALAVFLAQPWIRQHYYRAAATGDDFGRTGLLVLSRLPVSEVVYTHLPRSVGRGLLQANLTINGRTLAICSLHLESGKTAAELRARQLDTVFRTVKATENVMLLGDFNLRNAESIQTAEPYTDAWPALRPFEDGFTEDTSVNLMLSDTKAKRRQVRFDRVLIKGDQWIPAQIQLLGTAPISCALPRVFPSDHFGVLCQVVRAG